MNYEAKEFLLQALEHERGGVQIYETALQCAVNENLRDEWLEYLEQTRQHVKVLTEICKSIGLNPHEQTAGTRIVHGMGASFVRAMTEALHSGKRDAAQIVACECVVLAETKDHLDWELIGALAKNLEGEEAAQLLKQAYDEIGEEEDEHLYHTQGWCRELWLQALGIRAVLPPPEEERHVKSAIGAARAEKSRHLTP